MIRSYLCKKKKEVMTDEVTDECMLPHVPIQLVNYNFIHANPRSTRNQQNEHYVTMEQLPP